MVTLVALAAGILTLGCSSEGAPDLRQAASALGQPLGSELEPNGAVETVTPIAKAGVVRAHVSPGGDEDLYSFEGVAGERIHAATITSFSSGGMDSVLSLLAPDGTTPIETDDDNGSFAASSSSIAGATLTETGTHYLRVKSAGSSHIRPYDLHFQARAGSPDPEVEPNDSAAAAQLVPRSHWVDGSISPAGDVDVFALELHAGDTLFASLDLDPERTGADLGASLAAGPAGGNLLRANDPGGTGPDSEALVVTARTAGTYAVWVSGANGATGAYRLSVTVHPAAAQRNCTTYTSAGGSIPLPAGPGNVPSTIDVPGDLRIADIDVGLSITHSNPTDLDVVLQSPQGTQIGLFTDVGSSDYPDIDITLDDEAALPVSAASALNGFTFQPETGFRLDWLDGQNAGGTWTLRVLDDAPNKGGTLHGWSITLCEPPPPPACPAGTAPITPLAADFEDDDGGFTHTGTLDSWERGTPSQPGFADCHGGAGCFKTSLTGDYPHDSSQDLVSPPIDLTSASGPIRVGWAMRYQMENATSDHAWVEVREIGGASARRLFEWTGSTMQTSVGNPTSLLEEVAGWGVYSADLGAFAGTVVELVFHLDADGADAFPGLAVDDVEVTACADQGGGSGGSGGSGTGGAGGSTTGTPTATATGTVTATATVAGTGGATGSNVAAGGAGGTGGTGSAGGSSPTGPGAAPSEEAVVPQGGLACSAPADSAPPAPWAAALAALSLSLFRLRRLARRRGRP